MRILFFGRGVIGTQYAWAYENAGHTVEIYVRDGILGIKKTPFRVSIKV